MNLEQFYHWLATGRKGSVRVYHTGRHCQKSSGVRVPMAQAAWEAYEAGRVSLSQKRVDNTPEFEYRATLLKSRRGD